MLLVRKTYLKTGDALNANGFLKSSKKKFRARLVACGYSQVPGVDFNESYAPIINDVIFCVILIVMLIGGLQVTIIDAKLAFCLETYKSLKE